MSDFKKLIEKLEAEAERSGDWEAMLLRERIGTLFKKNALEAPHDVFLEVCKYGIDSLKDYPDNPADSPAAPLLLKYLQFAFSQYLSAVEKAEAERTGKAKLTTAKRREFLSKAFGLNGKIGRSVTLQQRMDICAAFSGAVHELSHDRCGEPIHEMPIKKIFTVAKRAAYKAHFGRDWTNDDKSFQALKETIEPILKEEGYLPKE